MVIAAVRIHRGDYQRLVLKAHARGVSVSCVMRDALKRSAQQHRRHLRSG